jgi:threonine/homoserine/homoserine lactone efflux protein
MNTHLLALYVAAVFLAMISPGRDMMFILATGMRGGARAGLLAMLGVVALLPQFVDRGLGDVPLQFAVLGAIFVAFEVMVDGTVGLASGRIGGWLSRRRRARQALDAGSGTIMLALAGRLALER